MKSKCPFCGEELIMEFNRDRDTEIYHCDNCYFQGDGIIWEALIQAKQDLEIATKANDEIRGEYETHRGAEREGFTINWDVVAKNMYDYAKQALEQIEHKD